MSRRNIELLLLIAALPPVLLLYALYLLNTGTELNITTLAVPLGLAGAFFVAHLAVRFFAPQADPAILPIVFALSGIGITFVTRLNPDLALRQLAWLFLSIGMMVVTLIVVRRIASLSRYKYTIILVGLILLILPIFIGVERGGSKIWLSIGGLFSFQPGELAKLCIVLFLAFYLANYRELMSVTVHNIAGFKLPDLRMFLPLVVMWGISLIIAVFERDLGSAVLFYGIFLIMIYTATGRLSYVVIGALLLIIGGIGAYHFFSHVQTRFTIWLDPFSDMQNKGHQIVQALFSLADGGLIGSGIGRGMPTKIPVVESDFIFVAIAEEMGLLGAAAVLLLFLLLAVRGLATAARAHSDAAAFAATGLTGALALQAFIIVGGTTKLIPLTGITLPFMSQGGSSLLVSFVIIALLLRCGDEGTGHAVEMTGEGVTDGGTPRANHYRLVKKPWFETPESGILGRIALSKRLVMIITTFACMFAILVANLTYVQVIQAPALQARPDNNHTIARATFIERGSILTSDGVTLAQSDEQSDGSYTRSYPQGKLASHVVGYISPRFGSSGIEAIYNETLTGHADYSTWQGTINSMAGIAQPGNDVVLTLNSQIQKAAEQVLDGQTGALVALDPKTGAILAMASSPGFDQSQIEELLSGNNDENGELINRATQALYPPGSTFKIATLSAAIESGIYTLDSKIEAPAQTEIGNAPVTNAEDSDYGTVSVKKAFAVSSNTAFGKIATDIGPDTLVAYARNFGYGNALARNLSSKASLMPVPSEMTVWETAWAGCGQPVGRHESPAGPQSTVLQAASIAATIANGGTVMEPYVVSQILSPSGDVVSQSSAHVVGRAVNESTAKQVKEAMIEVVKNGTGRSARINGVLVAGKTGTAEIGDGRVHSWFAGFAPADNPKIALALIIENAGSTRAVAKAQPILAQGLSALDTQ